MTPVAGRLSKFGQKMSQHFMCEYDCGQRVDDRQNRNLKNYLTRLVKHAAFAGKIEKITPLPVSPLSRVFAVG
jgi:hypothetical protein